MIDYLHLAGVVVGCLLFKKYLVQSHQVRLLLFPFQVGLRVFSLTEISTIGIFHVNRFRKIPEVYGEGV